MDERDKFTIKASKNQKLNLQFSICLANDFSANRVTWKAIWAAIAIADNPRIACWSFTAHAETKYMFISHWVYITLGFSGILVSILQTAQWTDDFALQIILLKSGFPSKYWSMAESQLFLMCLGLQAWDHCSLWGNSFWLILKIMEIC